MNLVRMFSPLPLTAKLAIVALALPVLGLSAAIQINGVCKVGNCTSISAVGVGQTAIGNFNFNYSFSNGDTYNVSGSYDNEYPPQLLNFNPTVIYIGNGSNTLATSLGGDTVALDMLQNFVDPAPGSWDGKYCETIPFTVGAGGFASGDTYFDGNSVGVISAGPGSSTQSACSNITFSTSQNLSSFMNTQLLLNFSFAPGSLPGTLISSATPEPVEIIPAGLSLLAFGLLALRRRKQ